MNTKFENLGLTEITSGVTVIWKNNTELKTVMQGQGYKLDKPCSVSLWEKLDCRDGGLSSDSLTYCHLNVESLLILHEIYDSMYIFTKWVNHLDQINVSNVVDIIP